MPGRLLKIILLCVLILSLSGCAQKLTGPQIQNKENQPADEVQKPSDAIKPEQYNTKLIFIKESGGNWLVVDDKGFIHEVSPQDMIDLKPGMVCENAQVTVNPSGEYLVTFDYPYSLRHVYKVIASREDAPNAYAGLILDNLIYNGNTDYAISEYELKDVKVTKACSSGCMDVSMSFDAKPLKEAFLWGIPNQDGFIRDREFNFTLYGAEDTWLAMGNIYEYLEQGGKLPSRPETKYTPTGIQSIIYEDDKWSYYSDGIMLPSTKELQAENLTEYIGTINRINRESGTVEQLYEGERNYSYELLAEYDNKLYLVSKTWIPFSEGHPGYFGVMGLETGEYKKLIYGMVSRGTVKEGKGYIFADDKVMEVDLKTGEAGNICILPVSPDYWNGSVHVNSIIDGKMYIVISGAAEHELAYVIDMTTGNIDNI